MFPDTDDIFIDVPDMVDSVQPWKPEALAHDAWPPQYQAVYAWRIKQLALLRSNPSLLASAKAYYSTRPAEFIMHWMDTYNPRKTNEKWIPFVFFSRQQEFITFLHELRNDNECGLVEKCRDAGATWLACGYSIWSWLFIKEDAIGWGSRKEKLVDEIGVADSIFEKMRLIIGRLPDIFLPAGFKPRTHLTYMKLINPENGATITGESGDNIGRGGRKSLFLKDESAYYERPEKIEAALGDNTNVQVDISSVNGLGNVFHRRRKSGIDWSPGSKIEPGFVRVFIIDWRDHPEKTQEWYDRRRAKYEREGMLHIFAQEVDRDYSGSIENRIIPYEWIVACVDAHLKVPYLRVIQPPDLWMAGLDVADGGLDKNALALRQWIILRNSEEWGERDPGVSTRRTIAAVRSHKGIKVQYDSIGVGSAVKTEFNRLIDDKIITSRDVEFIAWNAGAAVANPFDRIIPDDDESLMNKDFFGNFKAQAWWSLRTRCYKTFKAVTEGAVYPADELFSLDSAGLGSALHQVTQELAQPQRATSTGLRTIVDKTPDGTASPNRGDAVCMAMFPVPDTGGYAITGAYSG